ncbi:hypothetical protein ACFCW7_09170 [Paenibacillus glucanolyticus]|uniref:hypothetical protein n=1 Tax=Paenibacillus glucanolyticus TaxID=59843 RepID=UPI0035D691D7
MSIQQTWLEELGSRLQKIDLELKDKRKLSEELKVKHRISEEAARYMGGDAKVSGYIKKNIVSEIEVQHQGNEEAIQDLLDERRAVEALVEVIQMHQ